MVELTWWGRIRHLTEIVFLETLHERFHSRNRVTIKLSLEMNTVFASILIDKQLVEHMIRPMVNDECYKYYIISIVSTIQKKHRCERMLRVENLETPLLFH